MLWMLRMLRMWILWIFKFRGEKEKMKLKESKLCVEPDCEEIINIKSKICPKCCCSQFILLENIVDRRYLELEKLKQRNYKGKDNL